MTSLNAEQLAAVEHLDGPLLILAGPGSGKTRVVTNRIAHMLEKGIPARQILALTFTNKAAEEMRSRVENLAPGQAVWISTFHRFCARMLRQFSSFVGLQENYSILDVDDSRKLLDAAVREARISEGMVTTDQLANAISSAKNQLITPENYAQAGSGLWKPIVERVYPVYQRRLLTANAVDFDDLLMHVAVMLRNSPDLRRTLDARYRYIMVDEYQDTNLAQYAIVRALSVDHPNLAVVGDPDQSIYGWRGASISNILEFEHDYPHVKVVRLEQNYRSTPNILAVADELIRHNARRKEKRLHATRGDGRPVSLVCYPTHLDEADWIAQRIATEVRSGRRRPRDFAIFYRTNALSRVLEHALHHSAVPYQIVHGVEFFQRKEVKDLVAYLHLINNPANDAALLRTINTPTRGIGKTTVAALQEYAGEQGLPMLEAARRAGLVPGLNSRATVAVARFVSLYDKLRESATAPIEEILGRVLELTGYRSELEKSRDPEDLDRVANVDELVTAAREFDISDPGDAPLERFLEQTSLAADTDDLETSTDKVTLMTLHAAKGLEFPVVHLVALEQGILPHERSREDAAQLEEERRLLFVGITRAQDELYMSYTMKRMIRGAERLAIPSEFLLELPRHEMETSLPRSASAYPPEFGADAYANQDEAEYFQGHADDDYQDVTEPDFADDSAPVRRPPKRPAKASPVARPAAKTAGSHFPEPKSVETKASSLPASLLGKLPANLATAASLLKTGDSIEGGKRKISPEAFSLGMIVEHPEYGTGKIVALSREGMRRQANVVFHADGQERRFILIHSHLRPVGSDA